MSSRRATEGASPTTSPRSTQRGCAALAGFFLSLALTGCAASALEGKAPATEKKDQSKAVSPATPVIAEIRVDFKLDPHLTRGLSMGDQWVSQPTFTNVRQFGKQGKLVVRAVGLDHRGRILQRRLKAEWLPADPDRVQVSPSEGTAVTITVLRAGQSSLKVVSADVSTTLTITSTYRDGMTQVKVSQ